MCFLYSPHQYLQLSNSKFALGPTFFCDTSLLSDVFCETAPDRRSNLVKLYIFLPNLWAFGPLLFPHTYTLRGPSFDTIYYVYTLLVNEFHTSFFLGLVELDFEVSTIQSGPQMVVMCKISKVQDHLLGHFKSQKYVKSTLTCN